MPEALSIAGIVIGYAALNAYARFGTAVSSEAQTATQAAAEVVDLIETSQALFGEKSAAISGLRELANECADRGWDGHDADAIDPVAVLVAESFVRALPEGTALPEFTPEPDGSVSLDWIQSRTRLFSLSVGRNSRLAFAWLDGTDKGHGVATFDGKVIPPRILDGINAIVNHGNAPIWAA